MILVGGLGSPRLVLASLCTLLVGLVWTAGFAAAAIGHLNLVSVAFGVLFIGLSIDFAIHLCVRYRELLASDTPPEQALRDAAGGVGGSLALCATTTAIGFYAFVPTEFAGVAELGAIAGTGMFISLFTNLTLLPALISWGAPPDTSAKRSPSPSRLWNLLDLPVRHARWVVAGTAVITLIAVALIPSIRFDPNPLRVRDPATDSVQVLNEMLADGDALPWNLNVLAPDLEVAREIAERIETLPSVDVALTLADFVPEHQAEKLEMLEDAAFLLLPTFASEPVATRPTRAEGIARVEGLERSLAALTPDRTSPQLVHTAQQLRQNLARLAESWRTDGDPQASLDALEAALTGSLPERLRLLRAALQAERVALPDLPADLVERMIATDGRARIEIFPEGDLNDQPALERYVTSVQSIAPDAFGEGLVILETGRAVVRSLRQALATAAVTIALLLLLLWRSVADAALVALPLALASIFTAAFSVPLGVSFNFANVIVIPLLLGMGVDTGIHLVHRCRTDAPPDGNLLHTSTARAVLLSAATTMASFGTLGFSSHLGMSSLGRLLVLGIALILVCNLVLLPALVRITEARKVTAVDDLETPEAETGSAKTPRRQRDEGRWMRAARWLLAPLVAWLLRGLAFTWRVRFRGTDPLVNPDHEARLGALWHRNVLIAAGIFRDSGIHIAVSRSRDGEHITAVMVHLGYGRTPRGSSSRGGVTALKEMLRILESRGTVCDLCRRAAGAGTDREAGCDRAGALVGNAADPGGRLRPPLHPLRELGSHAPAPALRPGRVSLRRGDPRRTRRGSRRTGKRAAGVRSEARSHERDSRGRPRAVSASRCCRPPFSDAGTGTGCTCPSARPPIRWPASKPGSRASR